MKRTILLLSSFLLSASAVAGNEFSGYGIGSASCGKYLQDSSGNVTIAANYDWWLAGFVTGANLQKQRSITIDLDGMTSWVTSYCQRNPLDTFMTAAVELDKELDKHVPPGI